MGLFGRALAGAGEGASQIASKYIDEQLVEQRAQVLADIQRNSTLQLDTAMNAPDRRANMRSEAALDTVSQAGATDTAALNTANNPALTQARIAQANATTLGTMDAVAKAHGVEKAAVEAATPQKVTPGEDLVVNGISIFQNKRLTPGEASLAAYREGLKGQRAADRDRVTEATITSLAKRLDDNQKDLDKLLADNPDAMTPPQAESHFFGDDTPGRPKPAYQNYQRLMRERAGLAADFKDITSRQKGGAAPSGADPLGIFPGGGGAKPGVMAAAGAPGADATDVMRRQAAEFRAKLADPDLPDAERTQTEQDLRTLIAQPEMQGADISQAAPGAPPPTQDKYAARLTELQAKPPATKSIMAKVSPEQAIYAQMDAMPGEPRDEVNGQPNPAHEIWQRTYGARFEELRRQLEAIRTGTSSAFETRLQRFKEQEARGGR